MGARAKKPPGRKRPNKQHALKGARLISLGKRLSAEAMQRLSTREDDARLLLVVADCCKAEGKASRTLR